MKVKYLLLIFISVVIQPLKSQNIPLPEHPRPDFERKEWLNLNGEWEFEFDSSNIGKTFDWWQKNTFSKKIIVPFPWGSELSGIKDEANIGWYKRKISIPNSWKGKRIFITIGASDWLTEAWIDSTYLGKHQGGYMPFSFEIDPRLDFNKEHTITIRADDKRRDFTLYGKQGYGNARGIWQTVYLEARGVNYLEKIHCIPDIDHDQVMIKLFVPRASDKPVPFSIQLGTDKGEVIYKDTFPVDQIVVNFNMKIPGPRLWSLEDPFLYSIKINLGDDEVTSYFGMRKVSVTNLPGTQIPYISLNNKPVYLQLTLDQSYHPQGFYTFPSDQFMKDEIIRSKSIGLNGIRIHIKPELPRKLYWADKLGLLVMADLPNSWGEPEPQMRDEAETTLKEYIDRDFNHPSIFSWIVFNETWGLISNVIKDGKSQRMYLPETQNWVASMYYLAKSLDPSRLVEDNSICCGRGHTQTDINSWHEYLPGWAWEDHLKMITENDYPGSQFHFEKGFVQGKQPNINSECGNVWGYDGSTGDVDWSYDYHRMMNTFRKYPKVAGWLYTEHHDVINEWNGYWRFDRTKKYTGFENLVAGMTLNDMHSKYYLSTGNEIVRTVNANGSVSVPMYLSIYDDIEGSNKLTILTKLSIIDQAGNESEPSILKDEVQASAWEQKELPSIQLKMPPTNGLAILKLYLVSATGDTLHRNFMHFIVENGINPKATLIESIKPNAYNNSKWDLKSWSIFDGLKVNGAGKGFYEYRMPIKEKWKLSEIAHGYLVCELSAKQLFDKDKDEKFDKNQDYMLGSKVSPSKNPNSYPMTDEQVFSSIVDISTGSKLLKTVNLKDDPADHQGILSWNSQLKDRKLREAGSHGYLIKIPIERKILSKARKDGYLNIKFETKGNGGLAVYGKDFGQFPVDINLVLMTKNGK